MAVIDMKKVILIGMQSEKSDLLKTIQSLGNLEISELDEWKQGDEDHAFEELIQEEDLVENADVAKSQLSEVEYALSLIERYNPTKKGIFDMKPQVDSQTLLGVLENSDELLKKASQGRSLEERLNHLTLEETRIGGLKNQMEPWRPLDIPLDGIKDTPTTRVILGTVNRGMVERFSDNLEALEEEPLVIKNLGNSGEDTYFFIIYHRSAEAEISKTLNEFAFNRASLTNLEGTPAQIIKGYDRQIDGIKVEKEGIKEEIAGLSNLRDELQLLADALLTEVHRYDAAHKLMTTDHTFILTGWVPAEEEEKFIAALRERYEDLYIKLEDPGPEETFPVKLENNAFVTPFEMVTDLFSTPNSRELDPNAVMAPFYAIFFGIMMGDAGYGIVMSLAAYLFIKFLKPKDGTKKLAGVIFIGGIFTFFWGAIFGGWFGDAGALWGIEPIWFNPLDEPIKMLAVCSVLGVIHLFVGIGVNAYINIKEGKILAAIFDQGLWYVLYIGLILWLAGGMLNLGSAYSQTGKIMTIIGIVGLILTQGRDKDNIFAKLFGGLASLYDITGFVSDVLSYSRLFALALTTGVIGMVINQLGAMLGTTWYGWIFAALILAGGHVFNILINVLGAFVHSSRLQYIEFFGHFFEGGGKSFKPLAMETKYTDIKQ